MNTQNLKAKLLLTYAHLGPEEAERLAQRDVEAVWRESEREKGRKVR
jgi:hypothetical protein